MIQNDCKILINCGPSGGLFIPKTYLFGFFTFVRIKNALDLLKSPRYSYWANQGGFFDIYCTVQTEALHHKIINDFVASGLSTRYVLGAVFFSKNLANLNIYAYRVKGTIILNPGTEPERLGEIWFNDLQQNKDFVAYVL